MSGQEKPQTGDQSVAVSPERVASQERLSVETNSADTTTGTQTSEALAEDTKRFVADGTLPATDIDLGTEVDGKKPSPSDTFAVVPSATDSSLGLPDVTIGGDDPAKETGAPDSNTADRAQQQGDNGTDRAEGANPTDAVADPVKALADETARRLVAADGNPQEMQRIFSEAVDSFGKANPNMRGTEFGSALANSLQETPGGGKLGVQAEASEGARDGHANLLLVRDDGQPLPEVVASQEHKYLIPTTAEERGEMAQNLKDSSFLAEGQDLDTVRNIVDIADQVIMAERTGQDPAKVFEDAVRDFQTRHTDISPSAMSGLFNDALKDHPLATSLSSFSAASEGVSTWSSGSISLVDRAREKGKQTIASATIPDKD